MIRVVVSALLAAAPFAALSAEVRDCDAPEANARYLATPYDEATRSFAQGDIGFLGLYLDAPANGEAHLMLLYPDPDGPTTRCALISHQGSVGYAFVAIARGVAVTETDDLLRFDVPVGVVENETVAERMLSVRLDRVAGDVAVSVLPE